MTALVLKLGRTRAGWAVYLSSGRQLARFYGPYSRRRALSFIRRGAGLGLTGRGAWGT